MFKGFKKFLSQRNTLDMAVGLIIGATLTNITKSLTSNIINPLIGLMFGRIDFSNFVVQIGETKFGVGAFANSVINFIIITLFVFWIAKGLMKVTNYKKNRSKTSEQLLEEILVELKREDKKDNNKRYASKNNKKHHKNYKRNRRHRYYKRLKRRFKKSKQSNRKKKAKK